MSGTKDDFRRHDVVETSKHVFIDDFPINYVTYVKEEMLDTVGIHEVTLKFIVNSFTQTNDDGENVVKKLNTKQTNTKQEKLEDYVVIASIVVSLIAMAISVMTMIFG